MFRLHLTKSQRPAVLAGAVLVALLLAVQAIGHGMENTPWLAGAVVVVAMVVIGLGDSQPEAPPSVAAPVAPSTAAPPPAASTALPPIVGPSQSSAIAAASMARPVPLTPVRKRAAEVQKFEPALDAMSAGFADFITANAPPAAEDDKTAPQKRQTAALKISFMVLALAIEKNRHGFVDTEGFQVLKEIFIKRLTAQFEAADAEYHDPSESRRKAIADLVTAEVAASERSVHESIANYAECSRFPLDPIVARINREVPIAFGAHQNPFATTPDQRNTVYQGALKTLYDTATSVMFGSVAA